MKLNLNKVHWGLAITGLLAAEASLVAATFAWVAIYSHLTAGEEVAIGAA